MEKFMESAKNFIATKGKRSRKGFTLIELIAVIVIIGILMAGAAVTIVNNVNNAKYATAEKDLAVLKSALDQYAVTHNGTFIGLFTGAYDGDLTGSGAVTNAEKLDPFLSKPINTLYDPWQRPYQIYVDYNTTTNQSDIVIYVIADTSLGLNAKDATYTTIDPSGSASTFTISGVAVNPLKKAKGVSGENGEPMAIRITGQYEVQ
ncbi:hypothetical protein FACS1894187_19970 [Synergistales bacterium]|nr:hypothetical protein FACS1894187_19970 [Synergistales bacterium]